MLYMYIVYKMENLMFTYFKQAFSLNASIHVMHIKITSPTKESTCLGCQAMWIVSSSSNFYVASSYNINL